MGDKPKRISEHKIVNGYFQYWLAVIRVKQKTRVISLHPALTMEDHRFLQNLETNFKLKVLQWSTVMLGVIYSTYYFGLRHKAIFYSLTTKNPTFKRRFTQKFLKFFLIPLALYNVSYGLVFALMKSYEETKIKEHGLYKKYHLEYIIESKPF